MAAIGLRELLPADVYNKAKAEQLRTRVAVEDRLPDPVQWITTHFYIPETKAPITLAPYQAVALREALSRDAHGSFRYSMIVWSDLKKTGKTTVAGAVAMWLAWNRPGASVRLVGNDLKQADSRVFNAIEDAIRLNPRWKQRVKVIHHLIRLPNDSSIESIAVDPAGEAGGGDDMVEFTELWAARGTAHKQLWTELTLSPLKFGKSFKWTDTYAGFIGESELLETLYKQGHDLGHRIDLSGGDPDLADLEVYVNESARLFMLWNTRPRLSWLTPAYYEQEAANLLESEFKRIHRNQWVVNAEEAFVPGEWWDACREEPLPELNRGSIFLAADAGISSDLFALVGVSLHSRTVIGADGKEISLPLVVKRFARAWHPDVAGGKLEFSNPKDPNDPEYPEGQIRKLCREYNVIEFAYDPYQLHDMAGRLAGIVRTIEFNQGAERMVADKQLRDAIRERQIAHDGDAELTDHIKNANVKSSEDGDIKKLRMVKRNQNLKIDLAVALSMANFRARSGQTLAEDWLKSAKQSWPDRIAQGVQNAQSAQPAAEAGQPAQTPPIAAPPTPAPPAQPKPEDLARALGIPQLGRPLKPPGRRR